MIKSGTFKAHKGDIFKEMWKHKHPDRLIIMPHVCNVQGAWGAGFVLSLTKQFPTTLTAWKCPEKSYKLWHTYQTSTSMMEKLNIEHNCEGATISNPFKLGMIQFVTVGWEDNKTKLTDYDQYYDVVNMLAQDGFKGKNGGKRPLRYAALAECMNRIAECIRNRADDGHGYECEIHCPEFGSGLGGGKKEFIDDLIEEIWLDNGIDVHMYIYGG